MKCILCKRYLNEITNFRKRAEQHHVILHPMKIEYNFWRAFFKIKRFSFSVIMPKEEKQAVEEKKEETKEETPKKAEEKKEKKEKKEVEKTKMSTRERKPKKVEEEKKTTKKDKKKSEKKKTTKKTDKKEKKETKKSTKKSEKKVEKKTDKKEKKEAKKSSSKSEKKVSAMTQFIAEAIASNATEEKQFVSEAKIKEYIFKYYDGSIPDALLKTQTKRQLERLVNNTLLKQKRNSYAFSSKGKREIEPSKVPTRKQNKRVEAKPEPEEVVEEKKEEYVTQTGRTTTKAQYKF